MYVDKTEGEVLLKILCSLNISDCGYTDERVSTAVEQLEKLKKKGLTFKEKK